MYEKNGTIPDNVFMSVRLQIAAMAMQGILSNPDNISYYAQEAITEEAFEMADALIKAEALPEE